jgi:hypothetical protein
MAERVTVRELIRGVVLLATAGLVCGIVAGPPVPQFRAAAAHAQAAIPRTEGWVLVISRCAICHSVEIAVQQRQGPQGWGVILDRMKAYGMPLDGDERATLVSYLVRHFGDPQGH